MVSARFMATVTCSWLVLAGLPASSFSSSLSDDIQNVERIAGCFAVTYRFIEDGIHDSLSPNYKLLEPLTEEITLEHRDAQSLTLVHSSITKGGREVAHFHEIWSYRPENKNWTQEVWSRTPADENRELRYSCTAPWQMNLWDCHAGKAAKPFRDDGAPFGFKRTDYAWLDRKNTILVTKNGWVQNEHNKKMTEAGQPVSYELGWITYQRIDDAQCKAPGK